MFERISGQPQQLSPFADTSEYWNRRRNQLVDRFTRNVIAALDREAMRFLREHKIVGEPVVWSPPLSLVSDLELPGLDPATVSVSELHAAFTVKGTTVAVAAQQFGLTIPFVRLLIEQFPVDAFRTHRAPRPRQVDQLRGKLTPEKLTMLHHRRGLTLKDIGAQLGVSGQVVAVLAHEYGVEIRQCASRRRVKIDPVWFRIEYVQKRRTLTDIADEVGCSINAVSGFAKRQGIPVVFHPVSRDNGQARRGDRRRLEVDAAWLRAEYHDKQRTLVGIAQELGMSDSVVGMRAREHGIVVRRGRPRSARKTTRG